MSVDPVTVGVKLALTAASMAITASQRFEGPRLKSTEVSVADYGSPFPEVDGYCRIDGCLISWSKPLREEEVESKTKGGKYSEYRYFWTGFAVGAGHECDAIAKIRMDNHLVFDLTKAGPISVMSGFFQMISSDSPVKLNLGENLRIYLGTDDQEVDPTYAAWCEDRYGPDSATARREICGAMFVDIPVEKFGNRVPQISMDVVNDPDPAYLLESHAVSENLNFFQWTPDRTRFHFDDKIWDTHTRTVMLPSATVSWDECFLSNGDYYIKSGISGDLYRCTPDGVATLISYTSTGTGGLSAGGRTLWGIPYFYGFSNSNAYYLSDPETITGVDLDGPGVSHYFEESEGSAMAVGATGTSIYFYTLPGGAYVTATSPVSSSTVYAFDNGDGQYFVHHGSKLLLIDKGTMAVTASIDSPNDSNLEKFYRHTKIGQSRFWLHKSEIDTRELEIIRTIDTTPWGTFNSQFIYDPINHALIHSNSTTLTWLFLDRVAEGQTTLGSITQGICERRGMPADSFDVTELTQFVKGYWRIQGTGADQLSAPLDIHDVDCCPHDFGIKFRVRGDAADELIEEGDFVGRFEIAPGPRTRLPTRVEFNYADQTADQQQNTASYSIPTDASGSEHKKVFDLTTYVSEPDEAQPLVERYLRRQFYFESEPGEAALTVRWAKLEPGDVKSIEIDGEQRSVRITEITRQGNLVTARWVRDDPRVHDKNASAGPTFDGRDLEEIYIASPAKAVVMDIPLLNDAEDAISPQLHYGIGNYGFGNFPGGIMWQGDYVDSGFDQWNAVESAEKAIWGYCDDALGDANPNLWDRGNVLTVNLKGGTLTSCTEADIEADPTLNQAVIGVQGRWEIVNFTTATLLGDGIWEISGFKRGRRGTEWAVDSHAIGDEFWLAEDLKRDIIGLSEIGTDLYFRGQTIGRDASTAPTITLDADGQTLMPYAPARLVWTTDGTDLFGEIIRRTRVGGSWVGGTTIPLSENSEEYEVDIMDGVDVVRTITVTGTNEFTYTAAQISADGGSVSTPPDANVYQMSDAVGRGFALAA